MAERVASGSYLCQGDELLNTLAKEALDQVRSGTPMAIRQKLSRKVGYVIALPDVGERLSAVAFRITPSTPEEHDKKVRADIAAFAAIVKEIGLQIN